VCQLTACAGIFELFVSCLINFEMTTLKSIFWGNEADSCMESSGVVIFDEVTCDTFRLFKVKWRERTDGLIFECLMETFEFAV
jgi:hypothetical protein